MATRGKWTSQEEEFVRHMRQNQGIESWKQIAEKLNIYFPEMEMSGKQCRERYINYVRFSEDNTKSPIWTQQDDNDLVDLFLQHGPKWASIVKYMPSKSENCLKNRFYGGLRRIIRKINRVEKERRLRKTKPIRYETLIRVLNYEIPQEDSNCQSIDQANEFSHFLLQLKINLLQATWDLLNGDESDDRILLVIERIHEFNAKVRGLSFKPSPAIKKQTEKVKKSGNMKQKKLEVLSNSSISTSSSSSQIEERLPILSLEGMKEEGEKPVSIWENDEEFFEPEMKDLSPKIQKTTNVGDLDYEISQIFKIDYIPMAFSFFEW